MPPPPIPPPPPPPLTARLLGRSRAPRRTVHTLCFNRLEHVRVIWKLGLIPKTLLLNQAPGSFDGEPQTVVNEPQFILRIIFLFLSTDSEEIVLPR